ncbi:hypothetical protein [Micromonospora polyrhachis]|uniref:Uncharacterized protein n=1 Tax=Micromonospora polyrhachis TaxID=1282883 RepID=A0A7W7SU43_9ACTN|nr:hypothetical protein [Micromonospora polyrhachis]MBB4960876.1 hypothetical protein [Micromonospora polyrhachis]
MQPECELLGAMLPAVRLELVRRVVNWTVDALPAECRELLDSDGGEWVGHAVRMIDAAADGRTAHDEDVGPVVDELLELADDVDFVPLWQLFNALVYGVGVSAAEMSGQTTTEILSACYDTVRDCADLPDVALSEPAEVVLGREWANDACRAAIVRQKELVREVAQFHHRVSQHGIAVPRVEVRGAGAVGLDGDQDATAHPLCRADGEGVVR